MQSRLFVMGAAVLLAQLLPVHAHATGQNDTPLTLEQAISLTLSNNPALRSAADSVAIAEGARLQAGLPPNPELSLLREGRSSLNSTETIQLSQVLEIGGKRGARVQLADQERLLAASDAGVLRATLRADVTAAYLDALTAQEHVALASESLNLASKASNAASRRVAAGKISPLEQTRSKVAEAGARLELSQAIADASLARRRLAAFWGANAAPEQPLLTPETGLAGIPTLSELQARLETSPQMQRPRMQVQREQAQLTLARAERIPDLTITLGSKKEQQSNLSQAVFGLSIPLPLFDRNQGNLLSAQRRIDKARSDAELEYLQASQALVQAHQRATLAQEQIDAMRKEILPAAQTAFDAAVTGFELGKFGFIDVLDAQRTLFQSRAQYLNALAVRYRALAELERFVAVEPTDRKTK